MNKLHFFILSVLLFTNFTLAASRPSRFVDLIPHVQPAPDQGETNTCWFMASTGAMELLLNKKHNIKNPKVGGKFDLSESFTIWQKDYYDSENPPSHFIEYIVRRFNHGEAILNKVWPYNAYNSDGTDNYTVWNRHPDFHELPRIEVPKVKTELLFARGKRYATGVLEEKDLELIKTTLFNKKSPIIVNYNDDGYWHVILIVGYDDKRKGDCYEIAPEDCSTGAFYVRDSNGKRWERRAYNWFLEKGNAAAVVELE
jgi:C1A family cysteine protease